MSSRPLPPIELHENVVHRSVIDHRPLTGWRPHGLALCERPNNRYHRFVVWFVYFDGFRWETEGGYYFADFDAAAEEYQRMLPKIPVGHRPVPPREETPCPPS